ncbi:MAG: thioredoxin-disulfide reductase [Patescibacteria group bacterium]
MKEDRVLILGSGPAGLTAAIYLARASRAVSIIRGPEPGGQLATGPFIHNFPGFPDGIAGSELMQKMEKQVVGFGAKLIDGEITKIETDSSGFVLTDQTDKQYQVKAVIVATGASPRELGVTGEERLRGRGVSYCATCDGYFFKDKVVAVIGGGDTALVEADFLSRLAKKAYLVHRRAEFRADQFNQELVKKNPKIELVLNTQVVEFLGDQKLTAIKLTGEKAGDLVVDGAFLAIGHQPNTEFLKGFLNLDSDGFIIARHHVVTSVEGVFACGDVVSGNWRQAIIACATGAWAAEQTIEYLKKLA